MLKNRLRPETLFEQVGENPGRHTRFTADPLNIVEKRSRLDLRKNSYALRVEKDWNATRWELAGQYTLLKML